MGVLIQVIARCGEGFISNLVYALLGVSAMSRVITFQITFHSTGNIVINKFDRTNYFYILYFL